MSKRGAGAPLAPPLATPLSYTHLRHILLINCQNLRELCQYVVARGEQHNHKGYNSSRCCTLAAGCSSAKVQSSKSAHAHFKITRLFWQSVFELTSMDPDFKKCLVQEEFDDSAIEIFKKIDRRVVVTHDDLKEL